MHQVGFSLENQVAVLVDAVLLDGFLVVGIGDEDGGGDGNDSGSEHKQNQLVADAPLDPDHGRKLPSGRDV
ncbi:hypothetical protein D3C75_540330 [compost metagenome]